MCCSALLTFHLYWVREKAFQCSVTGYCEAHHLFTSSSLIPCLSSVLENAITVKKNTHTGRGRESSGGLGRWGEDWEIKTRLISISVELQAQAAAGGWEIKDCNLAARIDSPHNLLLSALAQRRLLSQEPLAVCRKAGCTLFIALCHVTSSLWPCCLIISDTSPSVFELVCCFVVFIRFYLWSQRSVCSYLWRGSGERLWRTTSSKLEWASF